MKSGGKKEPASGPYERPVQTVIAGANPDRFKFPYAIPQTVPEGSATGHAFEAFFDFDRDGRRELE